MWQRYEFFSKKAYLCSMNNEKKYLLGLTLAELKQVAKDLGMPAFTGGQMAKWLYEQHVKSIDEMTNISKANRAKDVYKRQEQHLENTSQHHQESIHEDDGKAIEGISQTHKLGLRMLIQLYHIETIRRNIVGGTTEGDEEEETHRCLEPEGSRQRKGDSGKSCSDERLHRQYPPALGLQQVDERTPQRFDNPRQGEPSSIETHLLSLIHISLPIKSIQLIHNQKRADHNAA